LTTQNSASTHDIIAHVDCLDRGQIHEAQACIDLLLPLTGLAVRMEQMETHMSGMNQGTVT